MSPAARPVVEPPVRPARWTAGRWIVVALVLGVGWVFLGGFLSLSSLGADRMQDVETWAYGGWVAMEGDDFCLRQGRFGSSAFYNWPWLGLGGWLATLGLLRLRHAGTSGRPGRWVGALAGAGSAGLVAAVALVFVWPVLMIVAGEALWAGVPAGPWVEDMCGTGPRWLAPVRLVGLELGLLAVAAVVGGVLGAVRDRRRRRG